MGDSSLASPDHDELDIRKSFIVKAFTLRLESDKSATDRASARISSVQ